MRLLQTSKGLTVTASALAMTLALASPAYSQATPVEDADPDVALQGEVETEAGQDAASSDQILVTGSRIRRPNLDSTVPITSVGIQELTDTGDVNLGDALNDLPSLRSTFSQGNSTRFIGTAGLNVLDLRGLGTSRTLVLVNSRRHITASPGDYLVDVNTIPTDLIERVDIVTGGNSAIYGSDAVAGVVNFVLKRDFEGIRVRGQAGISSRGDRGSFSGGVTAGQNFAEGRGNVSVALDYAKTEPLYFRQRDDLTGAFSGRCQFNLQEDTVGEPAAGDGNPDQRFFCGVRNTAISNGGTISANATAAQCASATFFTSTVRAQRCLPNGQPRLFVFDPGGNLIQNVPQTDFRPFGSGNFVGGLGSTLRDTGQLAAGLTRYSANLLARFEVSPAIRPFVEAKYVHIDAIQEGQPSFQNPVAFPSFFGAGRGIRCDNPYLTPANIAQLQVVGRCAGGATSTEVLPVGRFNVDFGGRGELHDRDTYRVVAGVEGDFNDDWRYEVAFNYGRLETFQRSLNNLVLFDLDGNEDGYLLATDVVRNAAGEIVCRVNAVTVTRPDCVPINILGEGRPSQAALDFVNTTGTREELAQEYVATAFVSGDSSQLFELPGGPVGFALGAEYRRETAHSEWDELTAFGGTFLNAIQPFNPPAFEVKEAFGEIRFPLLRDLPFAQELTLEAAGRVSDYNSDVGTVFAYNIGGTYAPSTDLRFRANYSTAVRAPTQTDLFSPLSENFAFISDPCDVLFINNGPNRAANCAAAGVPVGFINTPARSSSTGFLSGGNPTLTEEKSKSYTIGGVFTPRFLPGFSFTVDYYNITVNDLIAVLGAQTIINQCYDEATIDNPFCATVNRNPDGTFGEPAVISGGVNFAKQKTEGVDFDVAYRRTFDNGHRLNLRAIATRVMTLNNFVNPVDPTVPNRQLSELGDPKWAANFSANYDFGQFDLGYSMRYIGKQTIGTYENQHSFNGLPPTNADLTQEVWYPDVMYHNLRVGLEVSEDFNFYAGVDNILDRMPPLGLLGTAGGDPFDSIGRYFYAGARVDF
jgi:outer membrane receptor protein involved in Fe transport